MAARLRTDASLARGCFPVLATLRGVSFRPMIGKGGRDCLALGLVALACGGLTEGRESVSEGEPKPGVYVSYEREIIVQSGNLDYAGACLPAVLHPGACRLVQAVPRVAACVCDGGLTEADAESVKAVGGKLCDAPGKPDCADSCLCEVAVSPASLSVDERCPAPLPYYLALPPPPFEALLTCELAHPVEFAASSQPRAVGEPCVPSAEQDPQISFDDLVEALDVGSPECGSGLCLAHRFQGRTDCVYGSTGDSGCAAQGGSTEPAWVTPQYANWRADRAVTCTCRCDGPDACACPTGMVCEPLFDSLLSSAAVVKGSYCVFPRPAPGAQCSANAQNCSD